MSALRLELPTIQNWSCHNCSGCCRQHLIEVTEEERQRILSQNWTAADGIPAERPPLVWHAGPPWKKRYRLAHREDGACVFLDERGLCRIHAKFGEAAKPLPCRIYPYAFHPAGGTFQVGLRFSCPSVVGNRGKALSAQVGELRRLAKLVVPDEARTLPPPRLNSREQLDWPDFLLFVSALAETLRTPAVPVTLKLLRALFWTNLVEQATFDKIRGDRVAEFLELMQQAAEAELPVVPPDLGEPTVAGRMQFRMLVAQYARKDTVADLSAGLGGRLRLLRAATRFARGTGTIPALQPLFREVPFAALEDSFGGLPEGAEDLFNRYFEVKITSLHFCGAAYYGVPFVEGFRSLSLIYPAILWIARWLAAGRTSPARPTLTLADIEQAMAIADHHHGYSPAFGQFTFRRRVKLLAQLDDIARLCVWYSR